MKLLFNKANKGAEELANLTGNYYANNDFPKISTNILLETEKIVKLIGDDVYKLASDFYHSQNPDMESATAILLQHIQLPIAYAAAHKFYQSNILSHEDNGRKLKIDKTSEAVGWEWMYDRDDQASERKIYGTIDRLINYLNTSGLEQWKDSPAQKATRGLFINSTEIFQMTYPIDDSGRFYHSVVPFISSIEKKEIKKALGTVKYNELLTWHKDLQNDTAPNEPTPQEEDNIMLLALIRECVPLMTMATAVRRFSLNVLPEGVVQNFKSMMQTTNASQAALQETIHRYCQSLDKQAESALNELQKYINRADAESLVYDLLPNNPSCQKFFRT